MITNKTFTGIVVDDDFLKIARIKVSGKKVSLVSIDKVRLVQNLKTKKEAIQAEPDNVFESIDETLDDEISVFGLEEEDDDDDDALDLDNFEDDLDDLDFDDLEGSDEIIDADMADETEAPASNELLLYNLLSSADAKRTDLGLSVPAGEAIYQILKDVDFSDTKKKDLQVIVDDRLEALHGVSKAEDHYSYFVREDGALLLASIDDEPELLKLLNRTREIYRGKLFVNEVLPDEMLLLGLIRANYELEEDSITGVVQLGETTSRILFLKGDQLWIVSPIITEGIKNSKFLNTIFSKILFQLDTGEVPSLDRLIVCNNSLGRPAIEFFKDRFQDVEVSEFEFSESVFDPEDINPASIPSFTTAIGAAWAASGFEKEKFPGLSFLPNYVIDRQKIFKLQWHGFLLLLFILLTPIISNHFYTQNATEIDRLENEARSLDRQIQSLEPTVQQYNRITNELDQIQTKLMLLNELNQGTLRWSSNMDLLNSSVKNVNAIWLTSMQQLNDGEVEISGYSTYKNRIPQLADYFNNATLINVSASEIREQDVYQYQYVIKEFFESEDVYTPQSVKGIEELIQP